VLPFRASICALALLLLALPITPATALAQSVTHASGTILSTDGSPIAGAVVTLSGEGAPLRARSDARGHFLFERLAPGTYAVEARAKGFSTISGRTVAIREDGTTTFQIALARDQNSSLLIIGSVNANGSAPLSTLPVPSVNVNAQTYAAQGVTRVSDILAGLPSTTVYPIVGGGLNAPAVVALRGPDPSETLVDVDGHQVNNGSTGDFDLSLLDPADLQNVQVVYGIAPSSLYGPNTLGGALNVVTIEPTTTDHLLERFSYGSYDTTQGTIQATGSDQRWGYAFSIHRLDSGGELNDDELPNGAGGFAPVGNEMSAQSTIAKLRYTFGDGGFAQFSFHNQAVYRDLSATLTSIGTDGTYSNFSGSSVGTNNNAYGLDLDLPLGTKNAQGDTDTTAIFRHQTSLVSQQVNGPGAASSPYLYNDSDLITDDTLEIDHQVPHGSFAIKGAVTNEHLDTDNLLGVIFAASEDRQSPDALSFQSAAATFPTSNAVSPEDNVTAGNANASVENLAQTQRWVGVRYSDDPTGKLHYSFASYYSDYSTFGHSLDPRFGFVWTPTADSALRASVGTTFQSPQLPTFIVPSATTPIPVVGGFASVGNPNATAEHSTEYDLGYEHLLHVHGHALHLALDLYRTDLHNGVATFFGPTQCTTATVTLASNPTCLSFPVNVTREVYQGLEFRGDLALAPKTTLHASYDIDSVFTKDVPASSQDDFPNFEQSIGVPLHKITLDFEHDPNSGLSYYGGLLYEGSYNELNLPPYATLRAGVTWHLHDLDVALAGENLTNVYDFKIAREGGGIVYDGLTGTIPTNAFPLAGRQVTLLLTHKM
jgi:outer membrane receptor protein involved in Fe transport